MQYLHFVLGEFFKKGLFFLLSSLCKAVTSQQPDWSVAMLVNQYYYDNARTTPTRVHQ